MPTVGPSPLFDGKEVVMDFHPGIPSGRIVHAGVTGYVRRIGDTGGTEDELVTGIPPLVAMYDGLVAVLVHRGKDRIVFAVARR